MKTGMETPVRTNTVAPRSMKPLPLRTPPWVDDAAIAQDARSAGIRVAALSSFRIKPANSGGHVIGYGRVQESAIDPAVRELARATRLHL
jgi:DNA-binding transcriptional MocR family regulator